MNSLRWTKKDKNRSSSKDEGGFNEDLTLNNTSTTALTQNANFFDVTGDFAATSTQQQPIEDGSSAAKKKKKKKKSKNKDDESEIAATSANIMKRERKMTENGDEPLPKRIKDKNENDATTLINEMAIKVKHSKKKKKKDRKDI